MSLENPVKLNATKSVDYSNEPKKETDLNNTCDITEKMSSENLTLSKENNSVTKEISSINENCIKLVHSFINESKNSNDSNLKKLDDSSSSNTSDNISVNKSLSDEHTSTIDTKNSLQSQNGNGKDLTDTNDADSDTESEDHKLNMKSSALTNSSENSKGNINLDSVKPSCKNDNTCTPGNVLLESDETKVPHLESNTLQKSNDTHTGDLLVGKRKRENSTDEDLRKKQLKTERKSGEEKNKESIKSLSENNSKQAIEMESLELENEIFDDNDETSDTQDEDTVMKDLSVESSEDLSQQSQKEKPECEHEFRNKDMEVEYPEKLLENKSECLSSNVEEESCDNENLSSKKKIKPGENSSGKEKCSLEFKIKIKSLEELNGETSAEATDNAKDNESRMNKAEDKNLNISIDENNLTTIIPTSEGNCEKETLKINKDIPEYATLEKETNVPHEKDLGNGSSEEMAKETKEDIKTQHGSKDNEAKLSNENSEEKKDDISSEIPEHILDNLKNTKEDEEKAVTPSENIETSDEVIKNDSEDFVESTNIGGEETIGDIVIGEAFSINEEEMKLMDEDNDDESEKSDEKKSEKSEEKADETTPSASSVASPVAVSVRDKPSRKKAPSRSGKKYKRSSTLGLSKKKKKSLTLPKAPATQYVPPMKLELDLPAFLQELATIDTSLHVVRERYDEEGKKVKVHCIVFHETILDWAMSETLLSSMESSKALRTRLKVKDRSHLYPESYDSKLNEIHPVLVGDMFPFAMPRFQTPESVSDKEEVPLSFPLEQLCSLCPSASGQRTAGVGKKFNLNSVSFAEEPLEWAFKETFLSSFNDSPILSNIFELDSSSKCWPDFADVILTHEGVNYTFPFACSNSKKYLENFLFSNLSPEIPASLRHETLQIPDIRADLERDLYGERDSLVRLLAVASFYKHASCIPAVRTNRKLSVSHAALVSSFRPLIISQANKTAKVLRDIRADLLKDITCQDSSIIPCLINGPLHCKKGIIFSHLQRLDAAVAKDPNNKLQNI